MVTGCALDGPTVPQLNWVVLLIRYQLGFLFSGVQFVLFKIKIHNDMAMVFIS